MSYLYAWGFIQTMDQEFYRWPKFQKCRMGKSVIISIHREFSIFATTQWRVSKTGLTFDCIAKISDLCSLVPLLITL